MNESIKQEPQSNPQANPAANAQPALSVLSSVADVKKRLIGLKADKAQGSYPLDKRIIDDLMAAGILTIFKGWIESGESNYAEVYRFLKAASDKDELSLRDSRNPDKPGKPHKLTISKGELNKYLQTRHGFKKIEKAKKAQ